MSNFKKRLKEPSTWAGFAGILAAVAQLPIPSITAQTWLVGSAGLAGSVAVFLKETGAAKETPEDGE